MIFTFYEPYAIKYGVDEAIMIQNFIFWIKKNKVNKKHCYDGRSWTYNSVEAFTLLFPFWTSKQLRRIIESLVTQKVLMRGNFNKVGMDRTGWYAFVDEDAFLGIMHLPKWENGFAQMGEPIPDILPDSNNSFSKKEKEPLLPFSDLTTEFITEFNKLRGSRFKLNTKVKKQFSERIKEGYKLRDVLKAMKNAMADQFHIDNNFNHLTPEFITRTDKLEKYLNYVITKNPEKEQTSTLSL